MVYIVFSSLFDENSINQALPIFSKRTKIDQTSIVVPGPGRSNLQIIDSHQQRTAHKEIQYPGSFTVSVASIKGLPGNRPGGRGMVCWGIAIEYIQGKLWVCTVQMGGVKVQCLRACMS